MVKKFDISTVNGKLMRTRPMKEKEENIMVRQYWKIVWDTSQCSLGYWAWRKRSHVDRNQMKILNITREAVMAYVNLCIHCQKKSSKKRKEILIKPILHIALNSRAQLHLRDIQSQMYNEYSFIIVYQDHLTKFVVLYSLESKRAKEVAYSLLQIYLTFSVIRIFMIYNLIVIDFLFQQCL